jgi:hypothetical protein
MFDTENLIKTGSVFENIEKSIFKELGPNDVDAWSIIDSIVYKNKLQLDLYWIIKNQWASIRYLKHCPLYHKATNTKQRINHKCIWLFTLCFAYDNLYCFKWLIRKFGLGIKRKNCILFLEKAVKFRSKEILNYLIFINVDLSQGDEFALRYAQKNKLTDMEKILKQNNAGKNMEMVIRKFQNAK